jgi:hypothetical protein
MDIPFLVAVRLILQLMPNTFLSYGHIHKVVLRYLWVEAGLNFDQFGELQPSHLPIPLYLTSFLLSGELSWDFL